MTADELLDAITIDLYRLHHVWSTFRHLFASNKTNIDVLNATAPGFFAMNMRLMYDDVLLAINRITDRAKVPGKDTASVEQLLNLTGWEQSAPVKWQRFVEELKSVKAACKGCRDHRNQRLSHKALEQAKPLPPATRKMLEAAIKSVEGFVQRVYGELHPDSSTEFVPINATDDAERLLRRLKNRRSQKKPFPETRIVYVKGSRAAKLECGFCGEIETVGFYPDVEANDPSVVSRLHFAKCIGLIGCEIVTIEAVERNRAEPTRTFTVDLKKRLR